MDKSFQLIRTNPRLTTNIKLVVDSNYNLYFESFDSSKELSNQQYKHYLLNREAVLENEVPKFYAKLPKNLAFTPKSQSDADVMYNEYIQQFDSTYHSGANEVDDQWYAEEFEYFAPLYLKKGNVPKKFIILRVDEPAIYQVVGDDYVIGDLTKDNFRNEIIDKWKCISVFDLSSNTNVGKFFDRNVNDNKRFPEFSFFFDTKKYNYSKWGGLEYQTGVYKVSEMMLDDKLFYENPHFNLEEFITKGFEDNGLLYPYIFNMKFLFDDNPASPEEFKKWSMNRYYGFYAEDFELIRRITTAELPVLKSGLTVKNNVFLSGTTYVNPYVIGFTNSQWIQVGTEFYEVKMQTNGSFKIIADKNLTGYDVSTFNKGTCQISYNGATSTITGIGDIDEYVATDGTVSDMFGDIYLIEILGQYHILKKGYGGTHYIQSDYAFQSNFEFLQYWKGGRINQFSGMTSVINTNGSPLAYSIYRVKLTDIKDFDFDRINTHYSDFDYEKSHYVNTPEVKLYANEYRDVSIPRRKKTHDQGEDGEYKVKNISSEYTADDETFEIRSDEVTPIFEKNQSICKWGYSDSTSHSDYPYKLNNSLAVSGIYNRTTNIDSKVADASEKTLDYFYRIGEFYGRDTEDVVSGITSLSDFNTHWTVSGGTGSPDWSYPGGYVLGNSISDGTSYLVLNAPIIDNELYSIDLTAKYFTAGSSGTAIFGIDPNSFDNGTTTDTGDIEISFVGRAKSNSFRLIITDASIHVYTLKVTQIVNKYYLNQSTNIQTKLQQKYDLGAAEGFDLNYYVNSNFDYFDFFFKNNMYYENFGRTYKKPYLKYSIFGGGDSDLPTTTLFKGIEYTLYSVEDMVLNQSDGQEETIRNIITQGGQKYNGYKFSIILSENYSLYSFEKAGSTYINPTSLGRKNTSINGINNLIKPGNDGIHVFLNDKYKNILVIINKIIPINNEWRSLNNVDMFGENYGLYYGKTLDGMDILPMSGTTDPNRYNPNNLTASYFMESLTNMNRKNVFSYDNFVCYYYIDENSNFAKTEMITFKSDIVGSGFTDLPNWSKKFPMFYIDVNPPNSILLKKNSYTVTPLKGPETNIYDKYLVYSNGRPLNQSYIDEPLSRKIVKFETDETRNSIVHGETMSNTNSINRYIGYYEPIFKSISMFEPTYYWVSGGTYYSIEGNYTFGDELDQFATTEEIMYSKVNEYDNYLKLKNSDTERSYYPMVDEIGISQTSRFIFLSTWDRNFYIKTLNEQTFLQDYVAIPVQVIINPSVVVLSNATAQKYGGGNLLSGVNIYGTGYSYTHGLPKLLYKVMLQNLSINVKSVDIYMYYRSELGTTTPIEKVGECLFMIPIPSLIREVDTLQLPRPPETTLGTGIGEYTRWDIYFQVRNQDDGSILNEATFFYFKVYNDLINFDLTSPTVENGLSGNHTTGNPYFFNVTLNDIINKVVNIKYIGELSLLKYGGSGYWIGKTLPEATFTSTTPISFTNVTLDKVGLLWPFSLTDYTTIKYRVYHNYDIEGSNQIIEKILLVPSYKITGQLEPYYLVWNTTPPPFISKVCAGCVGGAWGEDYFTVNGILIKNTGSTNGTGYAGIITYNVTLLKGGVPVTTVTKLTDIYDATSAPIANNTSATKSGIILGPKYTDLSPLRTYDNENYSARISATYSNPIVNGFGSGSISPAYIDVPVAIAGCIPVTTLVFTSTLAWGTASPGYCNGDSFIGDTFNVTNIVIKNNGRTFSSGTLTGSLSLFQGTTQISTKNVTINTGSLDPCQSYTHTPGLSIGPKVNDGTVAIVTMSSLQYKVVLTLTNVGSIETPLMNGYNGVTPDCAGLLVAQSTSRNAGSYMSTDSILITTSIKNFSTQAKSATYDWKITDSPETVVKNSGTKASSSVPALTTQDDTQTTLVGVGITTDGTFLAKTKLNSAWLSSAAFNVYVPYKDVLGVTAIATNKATYGVGETITITTTIVSSSVFTRTDGFYEWEIDNSAGTVVISSASNITTGSIGAGGTVNPTTTVSSSIFTTDGAYRVYSRVMGDSWGSYITINYVSVPSFTWTSATPSIRLTIGECSGGPVSFSLDGPMLTYVNTYQGDTIYVNESGGLGITNNGGAFSGNLTYTFDLYEDGSIYAGTSVAVTKTSVTIPAGGSTGLTDLVVIGPMTNPPHSLGIVTLTTRTYKAVVTLTASVTITAPSGKDSASAAGCNATVPVCAPIVTAPVALAATNVTYNKFTTNWDPYIGETGFQLDVSESDMTFSPGSLIVPNRILGTVHSSLVGVVDGVLDSTTYYYRVRAVTAGGTTINSNVITVSTPVNPCLDENTLITLSDGSIKAIKYLTVGEEVISYKLGNDQSESRLWTGNVSDGQFDKSIVKSVVKTSVKGYYVINDTLKATPDHMMLIQDFTGLWRWEGVSKILVGYKLFKEDDTIMNVDSIVYMNTFLNIVKIDVEYTDNYFAGGVLNHNIKDKV